MPKDVKRIATWIWWFPATVIEQRLGRCRRMCLRATVRKTFAEWRELAGPGGAVKAGARGPCSEKKCGLAEACAGWFDVSRMTDDPLCRRFVVSV